jgi:hypothetical protein
MMLGGTRRGLASAALTAAAVLTCVAPEGSAEEVDLQLLFAVDFSRSVDADEHALQINGLANALRDAEVIEVILRAAPNGVAMALMQWAGPGEQVLSVPWFTVRDETTAEAFATKIEMVGRPTMTNGGTAIGDALARGIALVRESSYSATRQVIDISGDGKTNIGDSPAPLRARAVALGMTVNGLVILNEERQLNLYYYERVIGGPGAFVLQVQNYQDFARAMRLKLIREIEMTMATTPISAGGVAVPELESDHRQ